MFGCLCTAGVFDVCVYMVYASGGVGFCICYGCSFESCSSTASHGKFVILVFYYLLVYVVGYDVVCLLNHVRILLMYF